MEIQAPQVRRPSSPSQQRGRRCFSLTLVSVSAFECVVQEVVARRLILNEETTNPHPVDGGEQSTDEAEGSARCDEVSAILASPFQLALDHFPAGAEKGVLFLGGRKLGAPRGEKRTLKEASPDDAVQKSSVGRPAEVPEVEKEEGPDLRRLAVVGAGLALIVSLIVALRAFPAGGVSLLALAVLGLAAALWALAPLRKPFECRMRRSGLRGESACLAAPAAASGLFNGLALLCVEVRADASGNLLLVAVGEALDDSRSSPCEQSLVELVKNRFSKRPQGVVFEAAAWEVGLRLGDLAGACQRV